MGKANTSRVLTLEKGFRLLEFLVEHNSILLSEATEFLSIHKSSCHKFLYTLRVLGYIEKDRNKGYRLTNRISKLAQGEVPGLDLEIKRISEPYLEELIHLSRQTVKLGYWTGSQIKYVHQMSAIESHDPMSAVDTYVPAYSTAMGKAILAFLPELERHTFLTELQLEAHTPTTIVLPNELNDQLTRTKKLGFACSDGELVSERNAIAAPIFDEYGYPQYALCITALSYNLSQKKLYNMAPNLRRIAGEITQKIAGKNNAKVNKSIMLTVEKGFRLLEYIIKNKRVTLTEAAAFLSLHRSACYKFLYTLSSLGYIEKDGNKTYQLTGRIKKLSSGKIPRIEVKDTALPYMKELSDFSNETINLGYWSGNQVKYLRQITTTESPAPELATNTYIPAHCTSMGKAILAFLPQPEQQSFISEAQLIKNTPRTITTSEQLKQELSKIKACGYAFMDEELLIGLLGISAPVFDIYRYPQYAVSIAAPTYRINKEEMIQMAPKLLDVAERLTLRIRKQNIGVDI